MEKRQTSIGIVGPCAAGKTTLINGLSQYGIHAKHIAQEHSYVQDMWRKISDPDVLIYLDVTYLQTLSRRKLNWTENEYVIQVQRLLHARKHADKYINTDELTPAEVLEMSVEFLKGVDN